MHPRNPYQQPLDFSALAAAYKPLTPHLKPTTGAGYSIDFKNSESQRCLTEALLYRDFGLTISLPDNRLCPPVPNRLNYILWLQDIIRAHGAYIDRPVGAICGIDIGTGASAIYPMLGCKVEPCLTFFATELDEISFSYAKHNIEQNRLSDRIKLFKTTGNDSMLLPLDVNPNLSFEFTMCNPPFYGTAAEMAQSAEAKYLPPNAVCTGAEVEMITNGGELGFVSRIVEESRKQMTRCRWYTAMLGKQSSVVELVKLLWQHMISNYAITKFVQGQTWRWAIAWSFTDTHLPDTIARISNPMLQPYMPQRNTLHHTISVPVPSSGVAAVAQLSEHTVSTLLQVLSQIEEVTVQQRFQAGNSAAVAVRSRNMEAQGTSCYLTIRAERNTWSRSARRQALQRGEKAERQMLAPEILTAPAGIFVCGIESKVPIIEGNHIKIELVFQWIYGRDRTMFESFVNHVINKITRMHIF